jgi:hypothetical protein
MTVSPFQTLLLACATVATVSTRGALGCDKVLNDICFTYSVGDDAFWGLDCDFSAADIGSTHSGPERCGMLCKNRASCERWSWNDYEGGTCYLKGRSPWTLVAAKGVSCGFRNAPQQITLS